jgi:hypothetical protein
MTHIQICDTVGLLNEKLKDVCYLMQEIREDYFEAYDNNKSQDRESIAWEYDRYAALYRILDGCIYDVALKLREMDNNLNTASI